jgi:EAL domain-containing protein (putative c-di-GMP-specific phosphodiesterase class I)/DNA-binding NarL/FixJ family response regulator/GGDEF domain-containing protein
MSTQRARRLASSVPRYARTRVLVLEPDPLVRRALIEAIRSDPSVELVGVATDVAAALQMAAERQPDLALVPGGLPDGGSVEATLRLSAPPAQIGCIAVGDDHDVVPLAAMFAAGAIGFVSRGARATRVVEALHLAGEGDVRLPRDVSRRLFAGLLDNLFKEGTPPVATQGARAAAVRRVIEERCFEMVFQPIVDLRDRSVVGVEALARFTTEDRRSPDVWLQEAEEVGLRTELEVALAAAAVEYFPALPEGASMALNVSPEAVCSGLLAAVLPGELLPRIVVELTDHRTVMDYGALGEALAGLRAKGLRVAVDDSGHGLSSLQEVIRLRPDFIKLNRTLTRDVDTDPTRRALGFALTTIAAEVGARVIAEGIETMPELEALLGLGVAYGQGYLIARPGPLDPDAPLAPVLEPVAPPVPEPRGPRLALPAARVATVREACRAVLELLGRELPGKRLLVSQLDHGSGRWRLVAAHGTDAVGAGWSIELEESLCVHMLRGTGPRVCHDVPLEPAYASRAAARELDVVSYAGVPIEAQDSGPVGTLVAVFSAPDAFSERDLDTLAAMAAVIGRALETEVADAPGTSPAQRLREVARTDELTGALNHPSFVLDVEAADGRVAPAATYVLEARVEELDALVARSGRAVADLVVKTMIRELLDAVEPVDIVGRTDEAAVTAVLLDRRRPEQADFVCAGYRERLREGLARRGLEAEIPVRLRPWTDELVQELVGAAAYSAI